MANNMTPGEQLFARQCSEAGEKILNVLNAYPQAVRVCVLPGALASIAAAYGMPREMVIAMLDSALEDIANG